MWQFIKLNNIYIYIYILRRRRREGQIETMIVDVIAEAQD